MSEQYPIKPEQRLGKGDAYRRSKVGRAGRMRPNGWMGLVLDVKDDVSGRYLGLSCTLAFGHDRLSEGQIYGLVTLASQGYPFPVFCAGLNLKLDPLLGFRHLGAFAFLAPMSGISQAGRMISRP